MSMNIDPNVEKDLADLAVFRGITVSDMLAEYTAKEKEYWYQRSEDLKALESPKNGHSISHDEMKAYFQKLREIAKAKLSIQFDKLALYES